jgi:hypothetical protein
MSSQRSRHVAHTAHTRLGSHSPSGKSEGEDAMNWNDRQADRQQEVQETATRWVRASNTESVAPHTLHANQLLA